jgi:hypothetical protein
MKRIAETDEEDLKSVAARCLQCDRFFKRLVKSSTTNWENNKRTLCQRCVSCTPVLNTCVSRGEPTSIINTDPNCDICSKYTIDKREGPGLHSLQTPFGLEMLHPTSFRIVGVICKATLTETRPYTRFDALQVIVRCIQCSREKHFIVPTIEMLSIVKSDGTLIADEFKLILDFLSAVNKQM